MSIILDFFKEMAASAEYQKIQRAMNVNQPEQAREAAESLTKKVEEFIRYSSANIKENFRREFCSDDPRLKPILDKRIDKFIDTMDKIGREFAPALYDWHNSYLQ
jgi:alcohol dehydrogenase class IV